MNYIQSDYLYFIPNKLIKDQKDSIFPFIGVFTHKKNNRIYKKKRFPLGTIQWSEKLNEYSFIPEFDWCYGEETLSRILQVIHNLNMRRIKFDYENGELINIIKKQRE